MLTVQHIPQYEDDAVSWEKFLDKAAKGSVKAHDMLSSADLAYMVSLTHDPTAPYTLQLSEYAKLLESHVASIPKPKLLDDLNAQIEPFIPVKRHGRLIRRNAHETYSSLWVQRRTVQMSDLLNDAIIHCHASWSFGWLLNVLDTEDSTNFNSENIVAAMLMLAVTWKPI